MSSKHDSPDAAGTLAPQDGFEVLDTCPDAHARAMATDIVSFFSNTAHQHHEDEEQHVFPKLSSSDDPEIVQNVLRLQRDHEWIEEDWRELCPQLDAVAGGQSWYDLDVLREGAEIFAALLRDHITLEESCIYPEARARLRPNERSEMGREMAARRRPLREAPPAARRPRT